MTVFYYFGERKPKKKEIRQGQLIIDKFNNCFLFGVMEQIEFDKILKVELKSHFISGYYIRLRNNVEYINIYIPLLAFQSFGSWYISTRTSKTKRLYKRLKSKVQTGTLHLYKDYYTT